MVRTADLTPIRMTAATVNPDRRAIQLLFLMCVPPVARVSEIEDGANASSLFFGFLAEFRSFLLEFLFFLFDEILYGVDPLRRLFFHDADAFFGFPGDFFIAFFGCLSGFYGLVLDLPAGFLAAGRREENAEDEADGGSGMLVTNLTAVDGRDAKPADVLGPVMSPPGSPRSRAGSAPTRVASGR